MKLKPIVSGAISFVPMLRQLQLKRRLAVGTCGSEKEPRYCYSVFLRHFRRLGKYIGEGTPSVIAELGPGDSLGVGFAALIAGANRYLALDVMPYAHSSQHGDMFDAVARLFDESTPIPNSAELARVSPKLENYDFPFSGEWQNEMLASKRIEFIRSNSVETRTPKSLLQYVAPWNDPETVEEESVDVLLSQAVLEHVVDLETTYACCYKWLKPNGVMSHSIDFDCHGTANAWNGHWQYSPWLWRVIAGRSTYLLNRLPLEAHLRAMRKIGFEVVEFDRYRESSNLARKKLAREFRTISLDDLHTRSAYVIAIKRNN